MERFSKFHAKHTFLAHMIVAYVLGVIIAFANAVNVVVKYAIQTGQLGLFNEFVMVPVAGLLYGGVLAYPVVVTIYECIRLVLAATGKNDYHRGNQSPFNNDNIGYDLWIIFIGIVFETIFLQLAESVRFDQDWDVQLYNSQLHAPIYTGNRLTIVMLMVVFILGLVILMVTSPNKRPPLVTVMSMSALYMGAILAIVFTIQILGMGDNAAGIYKDGVFDCACILLLPICILLMTGRIVINEIRGYEYDESRSSKIDNIPLLRSFNKIVRNSKNWPVLAFVMMVPVLGIIIAVLTLFGQSPDAVIKAFTETADYTFSTRIPPQNIYMDEHYLCTVAAGGHKRVVKPLRMGKRHGHDVVVNRQLCVANAFEQILEEKTPRLHRVIRDFYDKYGFPVARLIKSRYIADIIWFIMKPLEWLFLAVIYLVDVHPEDRIARQYL